MLSKQKPLVSQAINISLPGDEATATSIGDYFRLAAQEQEQDLAFSMAGRDSHHDCGGQEQGAIFEWLHFFGNFTACFCNQAGSRLDEHFS